MGKRKMTTKEFVDLIEPGVEAMVQGKRGRRRFAIALVAHVASKLRDRGIITD